MVVKALLPGMHAPLRGALGTAAARPYSARNLANQPCRTARATLPITDLACIAQGSVSGLRARCACRARRRLLYRGQAAAASEVAPTIADAGTVDHVAAGAAIAVADSITAGGGGADAGAAGGGGADAVFSARLSSCFRAQPVVPPGAHATLPCVAAASPATGLQGGDTDLRHRRLTRSEHVLRPAHVRGRRQRQLHLRDGHSTLPLDPWC